MEVHRTSQPSIIYAIINTGSMKDKESIPQCSKITPAANKTAPAEIDIISVAFCRKNPFFDFEAGDFTLSFSTNFTLSSIERQADSSFGKSISGFAAAILSCLVAKVIDAA